MNGCFCKFCLVFHSDENFNEKLLVSRPYTNWKKAKDMFKEHFFGIHAGGARGKSGGTGHNTHAANAAKSQSFLAKLKGEIKDPLLMLDKKRAENVAKNQSVLKSVISTVLFCGKQNISLRGHRDDSSYIENEANNLGNFQALLDFRVESGDSVLHDHLENVPKNATYRSKTIQNEVISVIGTLITEKLVSRVNETGGYFSVSADETVDNKNQEQLVITIRYTLSDGHVVQEFLCFIDVSDGTTGEQLSATILEVLAQTGFDLTKMRGQCYDRAGNMTGKNKGS